MKTQTGLLGLLGALMLTVTACGSAELMQARDQENMDLRSHTEHLRGQVKAKESEVGTLGGQLAEAHTRQAALEDRLRVMSDLMTAKSVEIAGLESQLAQAQKAVSRKKGKAQGPGKGKTNAAPAAFVTP